MTARIVFSLVCFGVGGFVFHGSYQGFVEPAPEQRSIQVYLPPKAELRHKSTVATGVDLGGGVIRPMQIGVPVDEFRKIADASPFRALVTCDYDPAGPSYDYWIARGDGAWYHAAITVHGPEWSAFYATAWTDQGSGKWLVTPLWKWGEWIIGLSFGIAFVIFGAFLALYRKRTPAPQPT